MQNQNCLSSIPRVLLYGNKSEEMDLLHRRLASALQKIHSSLFYFTKSEQLADDYLRSQIHDRPFRKTASQHGPSGIAEGDVQAAAACRLPVFFRADAPFYGAQLHHALRSAPKPGLIPVAIDDVFSIRGQDPLIVYPDLF